MTTPSETIKEYISAFPKNTQEILRKVHAAIKEVAPDTEEKIAYGIPTFKYKDKNLVHYGGYAKHIGFYPGGVGFIGFEEEIAKYKHAKGSVQFPLDKPIPYDFIKRIVKSCIKTSDSQSK